MKLGDAIHELCQLRSRVFSIQEAIVSALEKCPGSHPNSKARTFIVRTGAGKNYYVIYRPETPTDTATVLATGWAISNLEIVETEVV